MPRASDLSSIYGIRHTSSGRVYVGSAVRTNERWRQHLRQLQSGTHHSRYLQAAWTKYGSEAFEFVVIEIVTSRNDLLTRENFWITSKNAANPSYGFNCCPVAGSQLGMKHSDAAKKKMSSAHSGKIKSEAHQSAINAALKGRKLSEECKKKLAIARTGTTTSDEARAKMSASRRGKTASAESSAKISAALKARHAAYRAMGVTISGKPLKGLDIDNRFQERIAA